jgi:hypothetical protein
MMLLLNANTMTTRTIMVIVGRGLVFTKQAVHVLCFSCRKTIAYDSLRLLWPSMNVGVHRVHVHFRLRRRRAPLSCAQRHVTGCHS